MENNSNVPNEKINKNNVKDTGKRNKKIIIGVFLIMLVFMMLCLLIPEIKNLKEQNDIKDPTESNNYVFAEPYEEGFDILKYDEYLKLDRNIMYYDTTGIGSGVVDDNLNEFNPGVTVIYNMINALIKGDEKAYNACLGDDVDKSYGFTQQQIYNVKITNKSSASSSSSYEFTVEYKIHENNGTYRRDMGSDEFRPLTVTVSNTSGEYKIEIMKGIIYK